MQQGHPDHFQTMPDVLIPLLPHLDRKWTIWEPAQGKGYLREGLDDFGFRTIGSDLLTGQDYLAEEPEEPWDASVTNPPYTIKDDWLLRSYRLGKPFALLMPVTTLEGKKRQGLFKYFGLDLLMLPRRATFETPNGKVGGAYFLSAWFTWRLPIQGEAVPTPHNGVRLIFCDDWKEDDDE